MSETYFERVARDMSTKLWINNPSADEARRAMDAGAVGATTNPQYCQKLLQSDPDYIRSVIDDLIQETDDTTMAAEQVYHTAVARMSEFFLPLYQQSGGTSGYVMAQGDPRHDSDYDAIVAQALRLRGLGANCVVKIPATRIGLDVIPTLLDNAIPICATGVFSVSQAKQCCEIYARHVPVLGRRPAFFITHVTGPLDQYWSELVKTEGSTIAPEKLAEAGSTVAREEYNFLRDSGLDVVMMGGGARSVHHFTNMVGADMCITLNWSIVEQLLADPPPIVNRITASIPESVLTELTDGLPNFYRALGEDALSKDEFANFGPFVGFRSNFLNGYARLLDEIAERRRLNHGSHRLGASLEETRM